MANFDLEAAPLVLAGPILRRVTAETVTVWLALKHSSEVSLTVYPTLGNAVDWQQPAALGRAATVSNGEHLHLVCATAIAQRPLSPGIVYAYDITLQSAEMQAEENAARSPQSITQLITAPLSYFAHKLPTFSLCPKNLDQLNLAHGSCRKPHGEGRDALAILDRLLESTAAEAQERWHQLFFTGDQIYADDVADIWLAHASTLGSVLMGWDEELPIQPDSETVDGPHPCKSLSAAQIAPGQRSEIARTQAGFTAMLRGESHRAKSHLFSFAEYAATYLLMWSPALWPKDLPSAQQAGRSRQQHQSWDKEVAALERYRADLWRSRRAVANVPTYMICDDHDVTDDFMLNRRWCERVFNKPLGRRVVQNGMLAYALFQAWGNTPDQFTGNAPGAQLLKATAAWSQACGHDIAAWQTIRDCLGLPVVVDGEVVLRPDPLAHKIESGTDTLIVQPTDSAPDSGSRQYLQWHYRVLATSHDIIVTDTRMGRGYPSKAQDPSGLEPPMLLSPSAFKQQLLQPFQTIDSTPDRPTLIVVPTNLITVEIIDWIQRWSRLRNNVFASDVGDSWNFNQAAFSHFVESVCQQRDRVLVLCGDIHYSGAVRIDYWLRQAHHQTAAVLVQLTSSSLLNSEWKTRLVHCRLKALIPERVAYWLGWRHQRDRAPVPKDTPTWEKVPAATDWLRQWQTSDSNDGLSPDRGYWQSWPRRSAAQSADMLPLTKHNASQPWYLRLLSPLLAFWRSRWMQSGSEVIGQNNLCYINFQWPDRVVQKAFWYAPWQPNQILQTDYPVSLTPKAIPGAIDTKLQITEHRQL